MTFTVLQGDARHLPLADRSVHCCVTSPPYWGLRDYGVPGQLGLEPTPDAYVANMVAVFREVWRVLRPDGTVWLNLGDSFAGGNIGGFRPGSGRADGVVDERGQRNRNGNGCPPGLKPKDLIGIPWRVALALQADGWWLRSDIVWAKGLSFCESYAGSCMPESVTDRPTSAHEHVFLLAKAPRYYYDNEAVKEPCAVDVGNAQIRFGGSKYGDSSDPHHATKSGNAYQQSGTRNLRNVWAINPAGFPGAHFATMPPALVEPCIKAGTSERGCCPTCGAPWERVVERQDNRHWTERRTDRDKWALGTNPGGRNDGGGSFFGNDARTTGWQPTCGCPEHGPVPCVVLDPFGGAGTTMMVADRLGRHGVGVELSDEYTRMARRRCYEDAPLLAFAHQEAAS